MAKNDPKLLAHVPNLMPAARKYCAQREGTLPYFRDGFVDVNLGRHVNWTDAIREATTGYAIADAAGVVQATYVKFENAVKAFEGAKPKFVTELELEADEVVESTEPAVTSARA